MISVLFFPFKKAGEKKMKISRLVKCVVVSLSFFLMVSFLGEWETQAATDQIGNAKNGIVEIFSGFQKEDEKFYKMKHASGFVVSNQDDQAYIVTTYDTTKNTESEKRQYCSENGISYENGSLQDSIKVIVKGDVQVEATVLTKSEAKNYCILQVDRSINEKIPLKLGAKKSLVIGSTIYSLGFKIVAGTNGEHTDFSNADLKVYEGKIQDTENNREGIYYLQHSAKVTKGNTGGPLLNEEGYVVGMNDILHNNNMEKIYYALPIDEIREILDNFKVSYESKDSILTVGSYKKLLKECQEAVKSAEYKTKSKELLIEAVQNAYVIDEQSSVDMDAMKKSMNQLEEGKANLQKKMSLLRKIVCVLAVIILGLGIWLARLFLMNKKDSQSRIKQQEKLEQEEAEKKDIYEKSEEEVKEQEERTVALSEQTEVFGESEEAYLKRKKMELAFAFKNRSMRAKVTWAATGESKEIDKFEWNLGKEEGKNDFVIYNNPAVSRKHAVIIWKEDKYCISDLNSVNGTFVNGTEVSDEDSIELTDGDRIVLANEVLEFEKI
jgi:S1-C subfamily serine protease